MKLKRKLLNDTSGYTLIELIIILLVFAIAITPIYKMVVSAAKIQKASEETYEATLMAQSMLQSVKERIEIDLTAEHDNKRKDSAVPIQPWLTPPITDNSLINFLSKFSDPAGLTDPAKIIERDEETGLFNNKFKTDNFLYEVHIWHLDAGKLQVINPLDPDSKVKPGPIPDVSFAEYGGITVPTFDGSNTSEFTMMEIKGALQDYFDYKDLLLWTKPVADPTNQGLQAVGGITYKSADDITIIGNGIRGDGITIDPIPGYSVIATEAVKISYEKVNESLPDPAGVLKPAITHTLVLDEINPGSPKLRTDDIIQLSVDLTTFKDLTIPELKTKVIRIENNTKAKIVIPVYNELANTDIKIYPLQHKIDGGTSGSIVVEDRERLEPQKNFVVGIIVRDKYNSTFGKPNKIVSKIVDVYSYDYNTK